MGFVDVDMAKEGTGLLLSVRGKMLPAEVI
jgi:hypothetical protein